MVDLGLIWVGLGSTRGRFRIGPASRTENFKDRSVRDIASRPGGAEGRSLGGVNGAQNLEGEGVQLAPAQSKKEVFKGCNACQEKFRGCSFTLDQGCLTGKVLHVDGWGSLIDAPRERDRAFQLLLGRRDAHVEEER